MSAQMFQARNRVPRIAEAAVERARLTVVPRTPARAARVPFVVLVSLLLVGGVAGLLCFNTSMQQASFTATAMEDQAASLDAKQQSLNMELDALRDPQRVAVRAKEMGMVPPNAPAFIRLSDGKVLGKPVPASSQNAIRVLPLPTPQAEEPAAHRRGDRGQTFHERRPAPKPVPPGGYKEEPRPRPAAGEPALTQGSRPRPGPRRPGRPQPVRRRRARLRSLRGASLVRLRIGFILIAMVVSVFAARLFQLQGVDAEVYAAKARSEGVVTVTLPANRGTIKDRNGMPLAGGGDTPAVGGQRHRQASAQRPLNRHHHRLTLRRGLLRRARHRLRKPVQPHFQYIALVGALPPRPSRYREGLSTLRGYKGIDTRRDPVRNLPRPMTSRPTWSAS